LAAVVAAVAAERFDGAGFLFAKLPVGTELLCLEAGDCQTRRRAGGAPSHGPAVGGGTVPRGGAAGVPAGDAGRGGGFRGGGFRGGRVLRVQEGFDADVLRRLLAVLEAPSC
jgi:hypothetical protein